MSYEIEWSAPALRELRKLDKPLGRRILRRSPSSVWTLVRPESGR